MLGSLVTQPCYVSSSVESSKLSFSCCLLLSSFQFQELLPARSGQPVQAAWPATGSLRLLVSCPPWLRMARSSAWPALAACC